MKFIPRKGMLRLATVTVIFSISLLFALVSLLFAESSAIFAICVLLVTFCVLYWIINKLSDDD
jgi:uncharacterized membrane protein YcaP (DUF421 family)